MPGACLARRHQNLAGQVPSTGPVRRSNTKRHLVGDANCERWRFLNLECSIPEPWLVVLDADRFDDTGPRPGRDNPSKVEPRRAKQFPVLRLGPLAASQQDEHVQV